MYLKYRIVENIASSVSQYESYRDQVYRYTPSSLHLQIRHNLSGSYLAHWKWLHPIVIDFNTLRPVQFYIHWYVALHQTHWGSYFEKLFFPCIGS